MLSECARASAPAESRYRIAAPNSRPRAVTVVALDDGSEDVVGRLAAGRAGSTVFRTAAPAGTSPAGTASGDVRGFDPTGWLRELGGRPVDAVEELGRAHLVVMIATVGTDVPRAAVVGELCRRRGITTTTLVFGVGDRAGELPGTALARTLAQVRPYSTMLVTTSAPEYCDDMLAALRA